MNSKKKYKALMLDIDGTLVANNPEALPSQRVTEAVIKASKVIDIGLATGRPLHRLAYLLDLLPVSAPCIINGGTWILDPVSRKVLKKQHMDAEDVLPVIAIAKRVGVALDVADEDHDIPYYEGYPLDNMMGLFTKPIEESLADIFISNLRQIPTISAHKTSSWVKNMVHVSINHVYATKQHGILEVARMLSIETTDIIGIGDHYNDFPLLLACGLKVAMGNAVEELKSIADYVAPSVEDDGVADVIEKFIL